MTEVFAEAGVLQLLLHPSVSVAQFLDVLSSGTG